MAGKFLTQSEIGDLARELAKTNSVRKREELTRHPTYAVVCGCPDPRCGGWHVVDTRRLILTADEASATLQRRKHERNRNRGGSMESQA